MTTPLTRLADRMLHRLVPAARAAASKEPGFCSCSDVCFYCTRPDPSAPPVCRVAQGDECM